MSFVCICVAVYVLRRPNKVSIWKLTWLCSTVFGWGVRPLTAMTQPALSFPLFFPPSPF